MNTHRNICRIIDYEVSEKLSTKAKRSHGRGGPMFNDLSDLSNKVEINIYLISESYNLSLFDLYCTSQAEKTEISEDFLIETSFQVLKACEYLGR